MCYDVKVKGETRRILSLFCRSDKSPFTISIPMQIHLCIGRGVKRLLGDKTFFVVTIAVNFVMSLVLGSVYFDLPSTADAMNRRASVIFFAILFNGLSSALEVC